MEVFKKLSKCGINQSKRGLPAGSCLDCLWVYEYRLITQLTIQTKPIQQYENTEYRQIHGSNYPNAKKRQNAEKI